MSEQTRTVQNGLGGKLLTPIFYKGLFFCERGFRLTYRACLYQFEILLSSEKFYCGAFSFFILPYHLKCGTIQVSKIHSFSHASFFCIIENAIFPVITAFFEDLAGKNHTYDLHYSNLDFPCNYRLFCKIDREKSYLCIECII